MAGIILYLFSMEWATFARKAAPGGLFANLVMNCCYWFLTMLGGVHFSTAITEEVEEQTLPLLKMTGASSFSILTGKSLPRLGVAVLFLLSAMPFLVLALTLGGVLPLGLASGILGVLCYAVMLSQLGLLSSVVCRNGKQAFMMTALGWAVIELCHWWYALITSLFAFGLRDTEVGRIGSTIMTDWLAWVPSCSLLADFSDSLLTFNTLNTSGADISWFAWLTAVGSAVLKFHMGAHLILAAIFFLISWRLFEPMTSRMASRGDTTLATTATRASVHRAWDNALAWKAHQFAAGGNLWLFVRLLILPVTIAAFCIALIVLGEDAHPLAIGMAAIWLGIPFLLINASRMLGSVFSDEIHAKTLPSLIMLPQSTYSTAAAMVAGLVPSMLAAAFCLAGGIALFVTAGLYETDWNNLEDLWRVIVEPGVWQFLSLLLLTLHIGVYMSTRLRYGGMILAFVLVFMTSCCAMPVMGELIFASNDAARYVVMIVLILAELFFCFVIQKAIVRRLEELAAK